MDSSTTIAAAALQIVLRGVAAATNAPEDTCTVLSRWVAAQTDGSSDDGISLMDLLVGSRDFDSGGQRLFDITLGVAILREKSRQGMKVSTKDLNLVWKLMRGSLAEPETSQLQFKASRSAEGYLAVPLCSLVKEGKIEELFRLHVWRPDGQRGRPEVRVHAKQPFVQSWILAGQEIHHIYSVEPADGEDLATHAGYEPRWNDGENSGAAYKIDQKSSTLTRTGNFFRVLEDRTEKYSRDMTYSISAGTFHATSISQGHFSANLCYFDSLRGFDQHAGVLGPPSGGDFSQVRDPGSITPSSLADLTDAVRAWEQSNSVRHDNQDKDSTIVGYHKFFLGRALLQAGRREEALTLLNSPKPIPPIVAFCKEPSDQHRKFLTELLAAGVDIDVVDDNGYKALDYAVLNGDTSTEAILVDGYRRRFDTDVAGDKIDRLEYEAMIRKAYHALFEERLRPILHGRQPDAIEQMRNTYAQVLATDEDMREKFDGLRYLSYSDFKSTPRLPRYMDGRVRDFSAPDSDAACDNADFIIFLSYRWIHKDPVTGKTAPDNRDHTQFKRMLRALELFFASHPEINPDTAGIWMDSVSINRRAPMPGISALPMNIAQCNALITISDEVYWTRAWCSVEALMFQILRASYPWYLWYEYAPIKDAPASGLEAEGWELREAPMDAKIDMAKTAMTWEEDRAKIQFLERQARLLAA